MATKTKSVKELQKRRTEVKKVVVNLHDNVLKNTEELVDVTIKTGAKWQKLMAKAVKNSEPLMNKQVDLVFDTIESLKSQFTQGRTRVSHLLGTDTKEIKKVSKKVVKETRDNVKKVVRRAKTVDQVANKTVVVKTTKTKNVAKNDLKVIDGIGPKMEAVLNSAGVKSFKDLATSNVDQLKAALLKADNRYRLMDPSPWVQAAKDLV